MTVPVEYFWKISLRLKLRQSSGDAFQDFFSTVMEKRHGEGFVRVRPFGRKGDKGCDGYLQSNGKVFQCYGALNGDGSKVDYLINKMEEDFEKAKTHLSSVMKEWHLVHNLVDGLPIDAVLKMEEIQKENPDVHIGFVGVEAIEGIIGELSPSVITELLGPVATNKDAQELQVTALQELVNGIIVGIDDHRGLEDAIGPVPVDKLDGNNLPSHWRALIAGGWQNARIVTEYFDRHPRPLIGEEIAALFNERYKYLKAQGLEPASIMDQLYEFVTGTGLVSPARQVAAQALLAYFFESCDIFENVSAEEAE